MKNKQFVRIVSIILVLLMVLGILVTIIASGAGAVASKSALNKLKEQQKEIKQRMQEIKSQINSAEYEQSTALAKKRVLDEQVELTQSEIENISEQIIRYDGYIDDMTAEVAKEKAEEDAQWDRYKARIRSMEENGVISYYEIIFGANSYTDLLSRIDCISEIMDSDERMYQQLVAARERTEQAKADLEEAKAEKESAVEELEDAKAELEKQVDEASAMLEEIEANLESYEALYKEADAERAKVQKEIAAMEAELEKMQGVKGTGSFIWPCEARRVTSTYGSRYHPIHKTYRFHAGVDVGCSYGSKVYAADTGTVLTAQYSSSYGYYVVISHGNGYSTLYAHLSKISVKVGQNVTQGSVIAYSGSSGNVTGPHLHFEIRKNGTTINPLQFYTNYVIDE